MKDLPAAWKYQLRKKRNPVYRVQDHPAKVGGNLFLRLEMQGDGIDAVTQTGRLTEGIIEHMA